jgi:hypothetical protein
VQETLKTSKEYQYIGSQTDDKGVVYRYSEIHENFSFQNIRDLICVLIDLIPNFGAIHYRVLSTIVYSHNPFEENEKKHLSIKLWY